MKKTFLLLVIIFISQGWAQQYSVNIRIGKILYTNEGWEINYPYGNQADVFDSNNNQIPCTSLPSNTDYNWYRKECQVSPDFVWVGGGRYASAYYCDGEISEGEPNPTITCDGDLNFTNFYIKVIVTINGVDYSSPEIRLPDNEIGIIEQKLVTVKQRNVNQSQTGRISKAYANSFFNFVPPVTFTYPVQTGNSINDIYKASQDIISNEKYLHWAGFSDVVNHKNFTFNMYSTNLTSQFSTITNATVKANMPEYPDFELQFTDPWLIDDFSDPLGPRNRGMDNAQLSYLSNTQNNLSINSDRQGVLLNQGLPNWSPPYYTVSIPSTITLPPNGSTHKIYVLGWNTNNALLENQYTLETGIAFTGSQASASANLKGQGLSDDQNAYSFGSQRKFIKSSSGMPFNVYSSMGDIWLEVKPYSSWIINGGIPINSDLAKGPSLDYASYSYQGGEPVHELLVVFQQKSGSNSNIVIKYYEQLSALQNMAWWILKDTYSFTAVTGHYDDFDCTPVIAIYPNGQDFKLVYRGLDGLYLKTGSIRPSNMPGGVIGIQSEDPPVKIAGTGAASKSPSIYTTKTINL